MSNDTNTVSDQDDWLDQVRKDAQTARSNGDEYAAICSNGEFRFASTRAEAERNREEMQALRSGLQTEYEYDVVNLDAAADP